MRKRQYLRQKVLLLCLVGTLTGGLEFWHLGRPKAHATPNAYATTHLQIYFGEGKHQLSDKSPFDMYHKTRPITTTGVVASDERLNTCVIDFRVLGMMEKTSNRILCFDPQGQVKGAVSLNGDKTSLMPQIALSPDEAVWIAIRFYPKHSPFFSTCVRRYDKMGRVTLQFGEPNPDDKWAKSISPETKRLLTNRYKHRWGAAYRFGGTRIDGLWADRKGRVYVLLEGGPFNIFDADGKPLAAFDRCNDYHCGAGHARFPPSIGSLEGQVMYVDSDGRVYTGGWTTPDNDTEAKRNWLKVWEWQSGVRGVFSTQVPELGYVAGIDGKENVYYVSTSNERVYAVSSNREAQKIFEPKEFYRKWVEAEREIWLAQRPPNAQARIKQVWKQGKGSGIGPRVGHVCHVDKEGNLYLTLVGAKYFRIDKISLR